MKKIITITIILVMIVVPSFASSQNTAPSTEAQVHSALRSANPGYTGKAQFYRGKDGKIWGIDVSNCKISRIEPLRGMELQAVACSQNDIKDLSPLAGMKLKQFSCSQTLIEDLSPLVGMPLWTIDVTATKITDLTPLKGMSIQMIGFNPKIITKGIEVLRDMKSLILIFTEPDKDVGKGSHLRTGLGPDKFWEQYDRGAFKKNKL